MKGPTESRLPRAPIVACLMLTIGLSGAHVPGIASAPVDARIVDFTETSVDEPVRVKVGDILELRLSGNISTGYDWNYVGTGKGIVENLGKHRIEHAMREGRPMIGGPSTQTWRLRAVASGCQTVRFEYARPWEKNKPPIRSVAYRIWVSDNANDLRTAEVDRTEPREMDCD